LIDQGNFAELFPNDQKCDQTYTHKWDDIIQSLDLNTEEEVFENYNFVVQTLKKKQSLTLNYKVRDSKEECYETVIIIHPIFKFTNALVRKICFSFGIMTEQSLNKKRLDLEPGDKFCCYNLVQ